MIIQPGTVTGFLDDKECFLISIVKKGKSKNSWAVILQDYEYRWKVGDLKSSFLVWNKYKK